MKILQDMNNCNSPLKLRWDEITSQYKVNKPLDQSGEYVDKEIAVELQDALVELIKQFKKVDKLYSKDREIIQKAEDALYKSNLSQQ